ncbi:unnamed protein product, partial [Meganyctiphanes norvegica]
AFRSNASEVYLMNVSKASSGKYKCEVLAEYPSFEKASESVTMDVIAVPSGPPLVQSSRRPAMYSPGEILRINCTSPGAKHVTLVWYINGVKIQPQPPTLPAVHHHGSNSTPVTQKNIKYSGRFPDLLSVLQMQLKFSHFKDGTMHISCVAVLYQVYSKSTELHIRQFESHKTVAPPFLKLYGAAQSPSQSPVPAALILITLYILIY